MWEPGKDGNKLLEIGITVRLLECLNIHAPVVELADTLASGVKDRKVVLVQVQSGAQNHN